MNHKATISKGRFEERPVHVSCSCGTAGDFRTEQEAEDWINLVHFRRLTGISRSELINTLSQSESVVATEGTETTTESPVETASQLSSAPTTESAPETSETSGAGPVQETVGGA